MASRREMLRPRMELLGESLLILRRWARTRMQKSVPSALTHSAASLLQHQRAASTTSASTASSHGPRWVPHNVEQARRESPLLESTLCLSISCKSFALKKHPWGRKLSDWFEFLLFPRFSECQLLSRRPHCLQQHIPKKMLWRQGEENGECVQSW